MANKLRTRRDICGVLLDLHRAVQEARLSKLARREILKVARRMNRILLHGPDRRSEAERVRALISYFLAHGNVWAAVKRLRKRVLPEFSENTVGFTLHKHKRLFRYTQNKGWQLTEEAVTQHAHLQVGNGGRTSTPV